MAVDDGRNKQTTNKDMAQLMYYLHQENMFVIRLCFEIIKELKGDNPETKKIKQEVDNMMFGMAKRYKLFFHDRGGMNDWRF